jgi:hypothetical protein
VTPGVEKQKTKRLSVNSRLTGVTTTRNAQEILLTSIGFYIQSVTNEMRNEKRDDEKWCKILAEFTSKMKTGTGFSKNPQCI